MNHWKTHPFPCSSHILCECTKSHIAQKCISNPNKNGASSFFSPLHLLTPSAMFAPHHPHSAYGERENGQIRNTPFLNLMHLKAIESLRKKGCLLNLMMFVQIEFLAFFLQKGFFLLGGSLFRSFCY